MLVELTEAIMDIWLPQENVRLLKEMETILLIETEGNAQILEKTSSAIMDPETKCTCL